MEIGDIVWQVVGGGTIIKKIRWATSAKATEDFILEKIDTFAFIARISI